MIYVVFILLWIATFLPAWYLLIRLFAMSSSDTKLFSTKFLASFALYQFVIALPYLYIFIYAEDSVNGLLRSVAISIFTVGLLLSIVRFFFVSFVNTALWFVYGLVYDGLMYFYPYQHLQDLVTENLTATKTDNLLDLGAGSGNQSVQLARIGCNITAVDSSKSMLGKQRKKIAKNGIENIKVIDSDLMLFIKDAKSASYDKIALVNVLYTVQDRKTFWVELLRTLKPSGKIIITNSDRGGSMPMIKEHIRNRGVFSLFRPRLIAVFVIDTLISEIAKSGQYSFIDQETIVDEVRQAKGKFKFITRCYGGTEDGVNILFSVTK